MSGRMRFRAFACCVLGASVLVLPAAAQDNPSPSEKAKPSVFAKLVPAGKVEEQSMAQYAQMLQKAEQKGALAPASHPQLQRLRAIADKIVPFAVRYNPRARQWRWEVNLIGSKQINAFCMPGGKIAFYTGILETLKLTDEEVAMIMGHEIGHALLEHARERMAKSTLTQLGAGILGELVGGGQYAGAFRLGGDLLTLKFSRTDEQEADIIGLELAARAGYDPRAGITLWQKMSSAGGGSLLEFLSTHPSGPSRIEEIKEQLPAVMPIYEAARNSRP